MELTLDGECEILRWQRLPCPAGNEAEPDDVLPLPEENVVWFSASNIETLETGAEIRDFATGRMIARLRAPVCFFCRAVAGDPMVVSLEEDDTLALYSARGGPRARIAPDYEHKALDVLCVPDEGEETTTGMLALAAPRYADEAPYPYLLLTAIESGRMARPRQALRAFESELRHVAAVSGGTGLIHVCGLNLERAGLLTAVRWGERPEVVYETHVASDSTILVDADGQHAVLIARASGCLRLRRLDHEAPELDLSGESPWTLPLLHLELNPRSCDWLRTKDVPELAELQRAGYSERAERVRQLVRQFEDSPDVLLALAGEMSYWRHSTDRSALTDQLYARYPDRPEVQLLRVDELCSDGCWSQAAESLAAVNRERLIGRAESHVHHLEGLIALHEGRTGDAARALDAASALEDACRSEELRSLTSAIGAVDKGDKACELSATTRHLAELVRAVALADRALSARDIEGALSALDHERLGNLSELQWLGRFAAAALALETPDLESWLRKRRLLRRAAGGMYVVNLTVIPNAWSEERLDAVKDAVASCMDGPPQAVDHPQGGR